MRGLAWEKCERGRVPSLPRSRCVTLCFTIRSSPSGYLLDFIFLISGFVKCSEAFRERRSQKSGAVYNESLLWILHLLPSSASITNSTP